VVDAEAQLRWHGRQLKRETGDALELAASLKPGPKPTGTATANVVSDEHRRSAWASAEATPAMEASAPVASVNL